VPSPSQDDDEDEQTDGGGHTDCLENHTAARMESE
jgi:hypothetical protein